MASVFCAVTRSRAIWHTKLIERTVVVGAAGKFRSLDRANVFTRRLVLAHCFSGFRHDYGAHCLVYRQLCVVPHYVRLRKSAISVCTHQRAWGHGIGRRKQWGYYLALAHVFYWRGDRRGVGDGLCSCASDYGCVYGTTRAAYSNSLGRFHAIYGIFFTRDTSGLYPASGTHFYRFSRSLLGGDRVLCRGGYPYYCKPTFT